MSKMMLMFSAFILLVLVELSLWLPIVWSWRRWLSIIVLLLNIALPLYFVVNRPAIWTLVVLFFGFYRACNMLRLYKGRLHADYLYHASLRTSLVLIGLQLLVYATGWLVRDSLISFYISALLSIAVAGGLLWNLLRQLGTTLPPQPDGTIKVTDLPSLTVTIPARNETVDLEQCLESLLASTYRKLEIIVLDDCSQNKRTPEIIRSFAHDGVRFITGEAPPAHWLAKNYAYKRLAEEANGQILLFCGVDTRFKPESLTLLVTDLLQKRKSMLSVVPRNILPADGNFLSSLAQPGRYAWEFLLPRRFIGRPPVLSTCWLITKTALEAAGGFEAFTQSVIPERHLARRTAASGDSYSFQRSSNDMGVTSLKTYHEQQATAIRTRYPQLRKRPESVAAYSLLASILVVWPYKLLVLAAVAHQWTLLLLALTSCVLLTIVTMQLVILTYRKRLMRSLLWWPLIVIYDIVLINYSMWQYEFDEVIWKGRNVCLPVMEVIPHLPKLS